MALSVIVRHLVKVAKFAKTVFVCGRERTCTRVNELQLTTRGNRLNLRRVWDEAPARISSTGTRSTGARRTITRYRRFSRRV